MGQKNQEDAGDEKFYQNRKGRNSMKRIFLAFGALAVAIVCGCAGTTPIKNIGLPPVTTIEGTITQLNENGFTLTDNSGSIFVRAKLPDNKKLDISINEITVPPAVTPSKVKP
jgi:hypothetical protein